MKKQNKEFRLLNYSNRFLIGLIVALSFVHLAFEWESERIENPDERPELFDPSFLDEEMIQITYREVPKMPKPKATTDQIEVVDELEKREEDQDDKEEDDPFNPEDYFVDMGAFGEENLDPEYHPKPVVRSQFPHTPSCADLYNKESEACSRSELVKMIREEMFIPPMLRDIGEKQGVLIEFTVNEQGYISDIDVLQSTHSIMSKEAIAAIKRLPRLSPATQNELPVSMRMEVPIVVDFAN